MYKAAAVAFVAFLFAIPSFGIANASVVIIQSCSTTDLTPEADDCIGEITDPNNDKLNVDYDDLGNDKGLAVNELYYQLSDGTTTDPTIIAGLFGFTDWQYLDKNDSNDGAGTGGVYDLTVDIGADDGDWSATSGSLSGFSEFMIVLKAGNGWVAYLYSDTTISGGTFDLTWTNNSLSHITLYARVVSDDLPEPAVLGLLGLGLIGVGAARRRRKQIV